MSRRLALGRRWIAVGALAAACSGKGTPAPEDGTVLSPYLAIGDALAADRVDGLSELGATAIEAARASADQPGMDAVIRGAGGVGSADLASTRVAFETMSEGMLAHLAAHPEQRAGLVVVHCPMTFEGRGASWVQREGKVMNPYEGARMLHCGDKLPWEP